MITTWFRGGYEKRNRCLSLFNGNVNDVSGNQHHGRTHGATLTVDRFGDKDSAYSFDGTGAHIQFSTPVQYTPPFAVSFWFRVSKVSLQNQYLISNGGQANASQGLFFLVLGASQQTCSGVYPSGALQFGVGSEASGFRGSVIVEITPGQWHHVMGTWDGMSDLSGVRLYIDGRLAATDGCEHRFAGGEHPAQQMRLGAPSNILSHFLQGEIDDISIYDRVLSKSEVQALCCEE